MALHCRACGHDNPPGAPRCANCNASLGPTSGSYATDREKEPPPDAHKLEVASRRPTVSMMRVPADLASAVDRPASEHTPSGGSATLPLPDLATSPSPDEAKAEQPHYLITQVLGEPVELSKERPTRIGRGLDNEVIFPLDQVSRGHAEVRWDGSAYVIIDRGSSNGTFVNGASIRRRRLDDGDRIGVGPFTLVYRTTTGRGTKPAATPTAEKDKDRTQRIQVGGLAGDLSELPLIDLARTLELLKKTGEVVISLQDGGRGLLVVRDGKPVHAELGMEQGTNAAKALLRARAGTFRFASKPITLTRATIAQPLATLLDATGPAAT